MTALKSLRNLLPLTIKQLGIHKRYNAESAMVHWREIVGDKIAAHAHPVSIQRDLLFVAVSNPVWCHHLSMMKDDIITKINSFIGDRLIRDIRFQAGYLANRQNEDNTNKNDNYKYTLHKIKLENSELEQVDKIAQLISDEELKQKVIRILKKDLALKKYRAKEKWHECQRCNALCPPEEKYCQVCTIEIKLEVKSEIYKTLMEAPWLKYSELNKYIPCKLNEFRDVKDRIIASLINEITAGNDDKIKLLTLVMLTTGIKPEEITDALINKTIDNIRRKRYVSAPRS